MENKNYIDDGCSDWKNHTSEPPGHLQWAAWAEEMSKTHFQIKCSDCGLYKIWVPRTQPPSENL